MKNKENNKTTIQITQKIWYELNKLKNDSTETFIDVLNKLLKIEIKEQ